MKNLRILVCILAFFTPGWLLKAAIPQQYESHFKAIDQVISRQDTYVNELEASIRRIRMIKSKAVTLEEQYVLNKLLFDKYERYVADSAFYYLNLNQALAKQANRTDWLYETLISKCSTFSQSGLIGQGFETLDSIPVEALPRHLKTKYYNGTLFLLIQGFRLTGIRQQERENQCIVELQKYANPQDGENYFWALYWGYHQADRHEKLSSVLKKNLEVALAEKKSSVSTFQFMLSTLYDRQEQEPEWIANLCKAVEYDIQYVNRDPTSMLEVVAYLTEVGDFERAYRYMDYLVKVQTEFPDHARELQIVQQMKRIFTETQKISERQQEQKEQYIRWITLTVIALIALLLIILWLLSKQIKQRKNIAGINVQLKQNIDELSLTKKNLEISNQRIWDSAKQLSQINEELKDANYIKEEYIGSLFSTCSEYLNKMDAYRLDINRKIKAGKVEDVLRQTQAANSFMQDEVKELNRTFDSTFLSIYPDFVRDFNTLMLDEEQFTLKGDALNTDLRIYALIWLGISSSSKIANLLHVSAQTIYNARVKTRSKSKTGNVGADQFVEMVQSLGRGKIQ